jgi:hypothetical protein
MVDPLLTALLISSIFFFRAANSMVDLDVGEPPAWSDFQP